MDPLKSKPQIVRTAICSILNMADIAVAPEAFAMLGVTVEVETLPPEREVLLENIHKYDAYFATLKVRFDKEVIDKAVRLKVIATPSTGLDHIDLAYAAEKGIKVLSLKDDTAFLDSITATAELSWALLLAVVRRIPWAFESAKKGAWARDEFRGHQLSGKTLGILGYGRLGRIVAEYGRAFRMRILACDVREVEAAPYVEMVDFDSLLAKSDIISIHIHLTKENTHLINKSVFDKMKPGAVLINTSRGAIIDEAALVEALESGRLLGAGLDVIDGEWNENLSSHLLIQYANSHGNLVITPHIGGVTDESQSMTIRHMVGKLKSHLVTAEGAALELPQKGRVPLAGGGAKLREIVE